MHILICVVFFIGALNNIIMMNFYYFTQNILFILKSLHTHRVWIFDYIRWIQWWLCWFSLMIIIHFLVSFLSGRANFCYRMSDTSWQHSIAPCESIEFCCLSKSIENREKLRLNCHKKQFLIRHQSSIEIRKSLPIHERNCLTNVFSLCF